MVRIIDRQRSASGDHVIGKTIAIFENRYGEELATLLSKRGALAMRAPALAELPDLDAQYIARLVPQIEAEPPRAFVFQTGVGTQALFQAADKLQLTDRLLAVIAASTVVARGPKPSGPLRARGVRIDRNAGDPFTTAEVLHAMRDVPVEGGTVVVQRYGGANLELDRGLEARGARVVEVPLYRWALPEDTAPMVEFMNALALGRVDAAAFTNAAQVRNLYALADKLGRRLALDAGLQNAIVASIGPVCTKALQEFGVGVDIEAHPPKLGPFVQALEQVLGSDAEQA
jgi:uroporphyrinogen-III synthase